MQTDKRSTDISGIEIFVKLKKKKKKKKKKRKLF
jgi:hypothetical protein